MTKPHDPKCPQAKYDNNCGCPWMSPCEDCHCMCDLIAEVRADERSQRSKPSVCEHNATPDYWEAGAPICRQCGCDVSSLYEMGN